MKAWTKVDDAISICTHEVDNFSSTKLGQLGRADMERLVVHRRNNSRPDL